MPPVTTLEPARIEEELTGDELAQFDRQGFLIVRGLADAETRQRMLDVTLDGVRRLIEPIEYEADVRYPGAPSSRAAEGGRTVRRLLQAQSRDFVFIRWLQQPGVINRLRQLLGPEVICPLAHHNCVMTKEPRFSSETGWHQDIRYWSFQRSELVNAWLALGSERPENGCLQLIPGSHRLTYDRSRMDDALFLRPELLENRSLIEQAVLAQLDPGDVLFFHCRTFHAAGRNLTGETKYSVVFTFRGANNPPLVGSRSASLPELLLRP